MKESEPFLVSTQSVVLPETLIKNNPEFGTEVMTAVQLSLIGAMMSRIITSLADKRGTYSENEDGVAMRWVEKYSEHFRAFCNNLNPDDETDAMLIKNIIANTLTTEDLAVIQAYLEDPSRGGAFLAEEELDEFIKPFVH